jgi:hypothetical protein
MSKRGSSLSISEARVCSLPERQPPNSDVHPIAHDRKIRLSQRDPAELSTENLLTGFVREEIVDHDSHQVPLIVSEMGHPSSRPCSVLPDNKGDMRIG